MNINLTTPPEELGASFQHPLFEAGGTKLVGPHQTPRLLTETVVNPEVQPSTDCRNLINNLPGKDWIQETKTVWKQRGLGAAHEHTAIERMHPAPFSFQDVARLIRLFTKKGMLVMDPFVGVGSTLKAAALEGRRGLGIELSSHWAALAAVRLDNEVPGHQGQEIWNIDIRDALPKIPDEFADLVVTSPPYWSILNKKPDHKVKRERLSNGLATNYSDDPRDLGNIADYPEFVQELACILSAVGRKVRRGRYMAVIISDFKHGAGFYPFHSDLYSRIDSSFLQLQGITILEQTHKSLYPYGYPFAYVPNIHHQYILIFRRVASTKGLTSGVADQTAVLPTERVVPDLSTPVSELAKLPYRMGPMASRHWGHPRHQLCSFPSKMKPAIAATLVRLFSLPGATVLDPFSGSGTIPFEAALHGRCAIASDLSPLAFVITSGKVNPPTEAEVNDALRLLRSALGTDGAPDGLYEMENEIQDFYHPRTAAEIVAARRFLRELTEGFSRHRAGLFLTACLAHVLHGNRPYALSRRSHNLIPIPPRGPVEYKPVYDAVANKAIRMLHFELPDDFQRGQVYLGAAEQLPLEDESVDVVITSPPFLGTTDFLRHNRLRNWLMGWSYAAQKQKQSLFLEHDPRIERYQPIVGELARVTKPGAAVVFHLGFVRTTNMAESLVSVFESKGFRPIDVVWEDVRGLEGHGRTDRGATHSHGFMILVK